MKMSGATAVLTGVAIAVVVGAIAFVATPAPTIRAMAAAKDSHPDFSGSWWPGPEGESPTNLVALGNPKSIGWAPLSQGLPENRKPPTPEELQANALKSEARFESLAVTDDLTRLANATGAPPPATTPEGDKRYKELSTGTYVKDYNEACMSPTVISGLMRDSADIVQTPTKLVMQSDTGFTRTIYIDGRDDSKAIPSMFGYSVGKWEGKTLVVTTTNIAGKFIAAGLRNGWPLSENAKLTEWFSITPDGKTLAIKRVFEDPLYYKEPIGSMMYFDRSPDDLFVSPCVEGLADQPYKQASESLYKSLGK